MFQLIHLPLPSRLKASHLKEASSFFRRRNHAYLRRCVGISLTKRWGWIVAVSVLGLGSGLSSSVSHALLTMLLSAAVMVTVITVRSVLRHRKDWQAHDNPISPFLRRL